MSPTISRVVQALQPSATIATATKAKELEATGETIYHLSLGEPDFDTPKHICDASVEAMKAGCTHYTTAGGIVELKKAVAEAYRQLSTTVRSDLTWPGAGAAVAPRGRPGVDSRPANRHSCMVCGIGDCLNNVTAFTE